MKYTAHKVPKKYIFACCWLAMVACIPIEDKINPEVEGLLSLRETYFYQDTLAFTAVFLDNSGMDSGSFQVEKTGIEASGAPPWQYRESFDMEGRRVEPAFSVTVPEYVQTGEYLLTVFGFDQAGNTDTLQRAFAVEADNRLPVFHQAGISLKLQADSLYHACRGEIIAIRGGVSDNLKISLAGFRLGDGNENLLATSADSVDLGGLLQNGVQVPPNIADGTLLELLIIAEDTFRNRGTLSFPVLVDCDDQPPMLALTASVPEVVQRPVAVPKGGLFRVTSFSVTDNRFLQHAEVYFNPAGEPLRPYQQVPLQTAEAVNLAEVTSLDFAIPDDVVSGQLFDLNINATDSAGNVSPFWRLQLMAVDDLPPNILLTDLYINRQRVQFSAEEALPVNPGDIITFDGRADDRFSLDYVKMWWQPEAAPADLVVEASGFEQLPVNLADLHSYGTFRIPGSARPGQVYLLKLQATDGKEQAASVVYRFRVR